MKKKDIVNFNNFNDDTSCKIMQEMEEHPVFYRGVKICYIENKKKINIYKENVLDETIDADAYDVMGPLTNAIAIVDKFFPNDSVDNECANIEDKQIGFNKEKRDISENCDKRYKDLTQVYIGLSSYKTIVKIIFIFSVLGIIVLSCLIHNFFMVLSAIPSIILYIGFIFLIDYNITITEKLAEIDKDVEKINKTRKIK